jgi:hypothetical protein
MSTTARRILEALEQFSTPVLDAKRIPLESSTPTLSSKRKRQNDTGKLLLLQGDITQGIAYTVTIS